MENDVVIISNRQKRLMEVVPLVLTNAHYDYCFHHLARNLYGETRDNMARNT